MNKNKLIIGIILLGLAYSVGRYFQPARVEVKTETVIKEVEVIKRDVEIIKKKKTNKDGSIEEEEITRDKSTETTSKDQTDKSHSITENQKPQWRVYGQAGYDTNSKEYLYALGAEKRYLGPISVGAWGNNKQTVGLSVSVEF